MDTLTFFSSELALPAHSITYNVGRALSELFPKEYCLETSGGEFDLSEYAQGGQCKVTPLQKPHPEIQTHWYSKEYPLYRTVHNAWLDVEWQGEKLRVVLMKWMSGDYREEKPIWIIAQSQELAERFYQTASEWCAEIRGEVLVFSEGCWSKSDALFKAIQSARFENLILEGKLKEDIVSDFERFFESRETYDRYRIPWKRGSLFLGPPGNGKTHAVKALVNHLQVPCLYVKSFSARYQSDHSCMATVFDRARKTTPCLLVLEDLDSLLTPTNRSYFLNELDGFAANTGIVVLATTNHAERLDPSLLDRPSRFDRKYHFRLPEAAERERYVRMWNDSLEADVRLGESDVLPVVQATEDFSFAYLKELFLSSLMEWVQTPEPGAMGRIMSANAPVLKLQMASSPEEPLPAFLGDDSGELDEDGQRIPH